MQGTASQPAHPRHNRHRNHRKCESDPQPLGPEQGKTAARQAGGEHGGDGDAPPEFAKAFAEADADEDGEQFQAPIAPGRHCLQHPRLIQAIQEGRNAQGMHFHTGHAELAFPSDEAALWDLEQIPEAGGCAANQHDVTAQGLRCVGFA